MKKAHRKGTAKRKRRDRAERREQLAGLGLKHAAPAPAKKKAAS